jgi:hypothetical protein
MSEQFCLFNAMEMKKRILQKWIAAVGFAFVASLSPAANAAMGGVDHLADNLSVTDFWVNGSAGFQASDGNAGAPSPNLPEKWHAGLTAHVVWDVRDWEHDTSSTHEADVPVDPYTDDGGNVLVHFLADGTVRVVVSDLGPRAANYPGPHDPIPRKRPWDMYPPRIDWRDMSERRADIAITKQRCAVTPDPTACAKQAREKLLDEQRADARRYLPRCAPMAGEDYEACETQAQERMRAARLARRCVAGLALPDCAKKNAVKDTHNAAQTKRTPN